MNYLRNRVAVGGGLLVAASAMLAGCTNTGPQLVFGPPTFGNVPPELVITAPVTNLNLNQGERFTITWTDRDPDSAARISFSLISIETGFEIILVSNIEENDSLAPDQFSVATDLIPLGQYNLRGVISDSVNPPVTVFALLEGTTNRVTITIGEPGINPLNAPPRIAVIEPSFNQGVAQDDTLTVVAAPTNNLNDEVTPYDPVDETQLFILLDLDDNPQNDDPRSPDPTRIIVLRQTTIAAGDATPQVFNIAVDLGVIPPRPDGSEYFVRATIIDPSNRPVHAYANGTIRVLRSASGLVDLSQVGRTLSGARWQGFNPGARLGTDMISMGDFDADGIDDFLMVAKFGNPRNFGNIGEAYLVYGLDRVRFGGEINVNSVATDISGVIFEAPPNRLEHFHQEAENTPRGITSVATVPDLTGDGRPDLLFGMGLVSGIFQGRDDDTDDNPDTRLVRLEIQQELVRRLLNNNLDPNLDDNFQGVVDTFVDRLQAAATNGDATDLRVSSAVVPDEMNPADRFILIAYNGLLSLFTTLNTDDIGDLEATLELSVVGQLPPTTAISAHQLRLNINNSVSYNTFGGDGMPGPTEDSEYETEELGITVNFLEGSIRIDVTETIQALLDGELGVAPGWIIVPQAVVDASVFSSEFAVTELRPRLVITYDEDLGPGASNVGCYPDPFANNQSDSFDDPAVVSNPMVDSSFEATGVAVMVSSDNRDIDGVGELDRLESTVVTLELAGQEIPLVGLSPSYPGLLGGNPNISGFIEHQAFVPGGDAQIMGCRFQPGWYDYIGEGVFGVAKPRADYFGEHVASMPDVDNDGGPEIIISAPRNELYLSTIASDIADSSSLRHLASTASSYTGSIMVFPTADYGRSGVATDANDNQTIPRRASNTGTCSQPRMSRAGPFVIRGGFQIFAENVSDFLGGAEHAGDVNLDGVPDIVCGAPLNDFGALTDAGAVYILYGRTPVGDVRLANLDTPGLRPPTIRIRGETINDRIGTVQTSGLDINGDRVDDVFFASPHADFALSRPLCGDLNGDGVVDSNDLNLSTFNACQANFGEEVFLDDPCKPFDFDNDRDIDDDDRAVFDCLVAGFSDCCPIDNGYVGVVFGNVNLDGDRTISQVGTPSLRGVKFYGASAGDRAGTDIASAGDFNRDGFGDLLISAPGVRFTDDNGRERMGVAYLIFGGTHLDGNQTFSLSQVGTDELPGIIFWSPFVAGRPNEAPIEHVGRIGDINNDGFDDIGLGVPRADFVDTSLPQDPANPGTDPNIGRRPDGGSIYIVYGNNTGSNQ